MTPKELMAKVDASTKGTWTRGEVKSLLNEVRPEASADDSGWSTVKVEEIRRGDVFYGTLVGGKRRPWLILSVRGRDVVAVALSASSNSPGSEPSQCRMWPDSHIGSAVAVFDEDYAKQHFVRPYANYGHIRTVEARLAAQFALRPADKKAAARLVAQEEAQ